MSVKENDYTCGTCKHYCYCYDSDDNHCVITGEFCDEGDTCDDWTDDNEPDLTEDDRYDGGVMSNFDNENPKEVEDYISEGRERE